jgi:hypothetical protein
MQDLNIDGLPPSTPFALKIVTVINKELNEHLNLRHGHTFNTGAKHKIMAIQISKYDIMSNVNCNVPLTDTL